MYKTAVIMAAGFGSRFGQYTENIPKGFIKFGGIPMIERSIQALINCGITRIIIGTGYHKEKFEELASCYPCIECVFSPRYAETNSMYTLYNCREVVGDDDFLLLESDLVFEARAITVLLENPNPTVMLITPVTKFQDQYYVEYDDKHQLTICSTDNTKLNVKGELVGIHKFSNTFYKNMCLDYSAKANELPKLGYEYEILSMAQSGSAVYVLNEKNLYWYEIDDPEDLAYAEKNVLPHLKNHI